MKKKLFLLCLLCLFTGIAAKAYDFYLSGIYYSKTSTTTVAVARSVNKYSGEVVIPSHITYNSVQYDVTSIAERAFYSCSGLTSVTIPSSVTSIGMSAFENCGGLASVTIGDGVTSIGADAFNMCTSLTSIIVDNDNTVFDSRGNCNAIIETSTNKLVLGCKNTIIPNSVTSIGNMAFYNCTNLTSIAIPNSVSSIGQLAFMGTDLIRVTIPASVSSIGYNPFAQCSSLTSIVVEESNPVYDSRNHCNAIINTASNILISGCKNTIIPNGVTNINEGAFAGCYGLTSINIPNGVTSLGEAAFIDCVGLTSITLPSSLTIIGDQAFYRCVGLTTITSLMENPNNVQMGSSVFDNVPAFTLYVPESSVAAYHGNSNWARFCSEVKAIEPETGGDIGTLSIEATVEEAAGDKTLVVNLANEVTTLTGYQMTLYLPEGVSLTTDSEGDYEYTLSSRHKKDHTMTIRSLSDGGYLLVCFSTGKKVIGDTEGELFRLPINVASTVSGTVQGSLQDILFSDTSAQPYDTADVTFNLTQSGGSQPSLTVQTLNLSTLPDMTVGAAPYALPQSTDQGLALTWTVQDATVASISNNQLTALKAGTTTVTATQAGNDSYQPFTKSFTLTVNEEQSTTVGGVSLQAEELNADGSKFLVVSLQNSVTTLTGYQMTLYLPEGVTLQTDDEGDYEYTLSSRHKKDHTMTIRNTDNGGYLLVCFSTGKKVIDGTEGELFRLPLIVASTVSGTVQGSLQDILFSDTSAQPYDAADVTFNLTSEVTPPVLTEQTLSLSALPELTVGDSPYALPQTTDQGLTLTWTVQDATIASVSNNQLTALKAGTTTVTASQAGNDSYQPFTKTFTLTVNEMPVVADPDTDISQLDNVIYVPNTELKAGAQNVTISINMKNSALIRGFQFDLYLPDGVTVAKSSKGKILASLNPNRLPEDDEHTLTMQERADGSITFLCGSPYPEDFIGNEGELISLTVNVAETMEDGEYPIVLQNMELTETDINKYYDHSRIKSTLTISSYMLGDINDDGIVNVRDYIGVANHILGNTPEGFIEKAGDVNEDGTINVRDYIGIANIILTGSIYGSTTPATMATRRQDVLEPQ